LIALALLAAACEPSEWQVVAGITLTASPGSLVVGESHTLTATCLDDRGAPIPDSPVRWAVLEPQLLALRPSGSTAIVYALHPGTPITVLAACQRTDFTNMMFVDPSNFMSPTTVMRTFAVLPSPPVEWVIDDVGNIGDTLILRAPTELDSSTATMRQVSARGSTSNGYIVPPSAFTYVTQKLGIASVSPSGMVRAVGVGETDLFVSLGAEQRIVPLSVRAAPSVAPWDVTLIDAHWTQGPQNTEQSIPMLRESRAAVVNVLAATTADSAPAQVVLTVMDASAAVIFTDTAPLAVHKDSAPTFALPNAQILVPRGVLATAASWTLHAIGDDVATDASPANNRLPRTGVTQLRVHTPPVLKLHLVPIVLSANSGARTPLEPEHRVYYDSIPRIRLPLGRVEVTIGDPIAVPGNFTQNNIQGSSAFFYSVLERVDAERVKSAGMADRYWIGLVPRATGVTSSQLGGMAFIPDLPTAIGPMSRTVVMVGHDWYPSAPVVVGTTLAHELGHTFARLHAPCGFPAGPDPFYPHAQGGVGEWVTWTSAFETGVQPTGVVFPQTQGDMMGYCSSNIVGAYTYHGILRFRALGAAALVAPRERVAILAVRGWLGATGPAITFTEYTNGERIAEPTSSSVEIVIEAADGQVLSRTRALLGRVGDESAGRPFTAHIPMDAAARRRATTIAVRAAGVERRVPAPAAAP